MNFCRAYPVFIILSVASGGAIAHSSDALMLNGLLIGLAVGMVPLVLLGIIYALMMAWRPDRPICRCGDCQSSEYEYLGPQEITEESEYEYQCPFCSRTYRQKDKRFWEVSSDGSEIPYMVISRWGRWQIESIQPPIQ